MHVLESVKEAWKFIYANEVVLLAYVNTEEDLGRFVVELLKGLERVSRNYIAFAIYKVNNKHGGRPVITLYIRGRQVFRQQDYFGNYVKDLQALKWGIRETLREWGIEPPF